MKTLSIIISTYNRKKILKTNIKKMLMSKCNDVEFLVCDNASVDETWEYLKTIKDERVKIYRNDINYGFENFWLISEYVKTKYFVFVNDRDYINPNEITEICNKLAKINNVDFISNEKRNMLVGYYGWKDAIDIYFQSRHPGTLIYNTQFIKNNMNLDIIRKYIESDKVGISNNYLVFQILLNVKRVYLNGRNPINQPSNRERIHKKRKEYYGYPYMSLEYRILEFDSWIEYGMHYIDNNRTRDILLGVYKDAIMTVTWEYYFSMKIPGLAERNHYENHSVNEWKYNGIKLCLHVLINKNVYKYKMVKKILLITVQEYINAIKNVMEWN